MKTKYLTIKVTNDYFDGESTWTRGETLEVEPEDITPEGYEYSSNRVGDGFILPRRYFRIISK